MSSKTINNHLFFCILILFIGCSVEAKRGTRINIFSQKEGAGDIVQLNMNTSPNVMMNSLKRNSPFRWNKMKDGGGFNVIPYVITGKFNSEEQSIIAASMGRIENNTCIRFKKRTNEQDYVEIQNKQNEGCYTTVGRNSGKNIVMLEANEIATCVEPDIVIHELFHSIGLWHEHMRYDRDEHIIVHKENIPSYYLPQFEKVTPDESTTFNIPYDYKSVMHYAEDAFADRGKISMETRDKKYQRVIGHVPDASPSDYGKICILYECMKCMGKLFEEKSFLNNIGNPVPLPNTPPPLQTPPTPEKIVVVERPDNQTVTENIEGTVVGGGFGNGRDTCFDLISPVCSMISSGNSFFSCSLTSHLCCQTCRGMEEMREKTTRENIKREFGLNWLGRK